MSRDTPKPPIAPHSKPVCPACGVCLMCIVEGKAVHGSHEEEKK